jgi:Family of unknown function (DUF6356)
MRWLRAFIDHPRATGESYFGHMRFALSVALECAVIAFVVSVHALIPAFFVRTGGQRLKALMARLEARSNTAHPH